jgi:LysM repeat protein
MARRGLPLLLVASATVASCKIDSAPKTLDTLAPITAPLPTLPPVQETVASQTDAASTTTQAETTTTLPTTTSSVYASWSSVVAAEQSGVLRIIGTTCDGGQRFYRGSGFLVGPGLLVTAAHVVAGFRAFALDRIDSDPAERPATVIGVNVAEDVALLSTADDGSYQFSFEDTPPVAGADVGLIGYSGARAPVRPTRGTVNQLDLRISPYGDDQQFRPARVIEHDIQTNGGDSGAPLLDPVTGRVVGINVAADPKLVGIRYAVYPAAAEALVAESSSTSSPVEQCDGAGDTPPATTAAPTTLPPPTTAAPTTTIGAGSLRYKVVRGDTLYGIARAFNTTFAAIQAVNDAAIIAVIHEGDTIVLPAGARALTASDVATITYVVQSGDSIIKIAKATGTTPAELLVINKMLSTPDVLQVGQRLLVPQFG